MAGLGFWFLKNTFAKHLPRRSSPSWNKSFGVTKEGSLSTVASAAHTNTRAEHPWVWQAGSNRRSLTLSKMSFEVSVNWKLAESQNPWDTDLWACLLGGLIVLISPPVVGSYEPGFRSGGRARWGGHSIITRCFLTVGAVWLPSVMDLYPGPAIQTNLVSHIDLVGIFSQQQKGGPSTLLPSQLCTFWFCLYIRMLEISQRTLLSPPWLTSLGYWLLCSIWN